MLRCGDLPEALLLVTKKFATKCKLSRYLITQTFRNTNNGGISLYLSGFRMCFQLRTVAVKKKKFFIIAIVFDIQKSE